MTKFVRFYFYYRKYNKHRLFYYIVKLQPFHLSLSDYKNNLVLFNIFISHNKTKSSFPCYFVIVNYLFFFKTLNSDSVKLNSNLFSL